MSFIETLHYITLSRKKEYGKEKTNRNKKLEEIKQSKRNYTVMFITIYKALKH